MIIKNFSTPQREEIILNDISSEGLFFTIPASFDSVFSKLKTNILYVLFTLINSFTAVSKQLIS